MKSFPTLTDLSSIKYGGSEINPSLPSFIKKSKIDSKFDQDQLSDDGEDFIDLPAPESKKDPIQQDCDGGSGNSDDLHLTADSSGDRKDSSDESDCDVVVEANHDNKLVKVCVDDNEEFCKTVKTHPSACTDFYKSSPPVSKTTQQMLIEIWEHSTKGQPWIYRDLLSAYSDRVLCSITELCSPANPIYFSEIERLNKEKSYDGTVDYFWTDLEFRDVCLARLFLERQKILNERNKKQPGRNFCTVVFVTNLLHSSAYIISSRYVLFIDSLYNFGKCEMVGLIGIDRYCALADGAIVSDLQIISLLPTFSNQTYQACSVGCFVFANYLVSVCLDLKDLLFNQNLPIYSFTPRAGNLLLLDMAEIDRVDCHFLPKLFAACQSRTYVSKFCGCFGIDYGKLMGRKMPAKLKIIHLNPHNKDARDMKDATLGGMLTGSDIVNQSEWKLREHTEHFIRKLELHELTPKPQNRNFTARGNDLNCYEEIVGGRKRLAFVPSRSLLQTIEVNKTKTSMPTTSRFCSSELVRMQREEGKYLMSDKTIDLYHYFFTASKQEKQAAKERFNKETGFFME